MPTTPLPQSTDELYQALQENHERPYGRARTVTAEELAEAAEQFEEPVPLIHALLELQEAYTYGSEPRKSPVVFARLLTLFDEQPDLFDERLRHTLFWRFKWVANALRALPEIPLASLRQWQTEMRDRYEKAGHGLQPYYGQAYQLASHIGEDTALAYELWAGRTRTRLSDCEACEICERALYHLTAGDDEGALRAWEPVLQGKESCQEEPARSISHALLPLLRTGRADQARELHLAGYRGCRRNPSMAGEVGRHLEFCALTGNEARGLELLAENRSLFDEVDSPREQFDFLTGAEVLLQRVEHLGHGELPAAGFAGRAWTVTGLRAEVRERADDLAARFDTRNGTTAHARRRSARLDREPLTGALELTLRTRGLDDVTPAAAPAPAARAVPPAPDETLPELIVRARTLDEQGTRTHGPAGHGCAPWSPPVTTPTPTTPPRARSSSCTPTFWTTRRPGPARRTTTPKPPPSTRRRRGCTTTPGSRGTRRSPAAAPCSRPRRSPVRTTRGGGEGRRADRRPRRRDRAARALSRPSPTWRPACCGCGPPPSACASSSRGARSTSHRSSPRRTCCTPSPPGTTSPRSSPGPCCCAPPPSPCPAICPPRSPGPTTSSTGSGRTAPPGTCPAPSACAAGSTSDSRTRRPRTRTSPRACGWPPTGRPTPPAPPASTTTWPAPACTWAAPTRRCAI
ncbi:hypothetical protein SHKM778_43370 [Streptomyces sp. KM77-8]|uniref:Tetratricopeptide repeat protein n=1 Tax=Streptomyces haneummycinicus TaxID=3074435 RepID=A0AAT9HKW7_9ACTN